MIVFTALNCWSICGESGLFGSSSLKVLFRDSKMLYACFETPFALPCFTSSVRSEVSIFELGKVLLITTVAEFVFLT